MIEDLDIEEQNKIARADMLERLDVEIVAARADFLEMIEDKTVDELRDNGPWHMFVQLDLRSADKNDLH